RLRGLVGGPLGRGYQEDVDRGDVDHVALPGNQGRDERQQELNRAKVVQVHRPREIVQAVERIEDRAPDRLAGVADHKIDSVGELKQLSQQRLNRRGIRQIAGKNVSATTLGFDLLFHFEQFVGGACHQEQVGFRLGETHRQTFANAEACSSDEDGLAGQTLLEFGATEPEEREKQPLHFPDRLEEESRRLRPFWPSGRLTREESSNSASPSPRLSPVCRAVRCDLCFLKVERQGAVVQYGGSSSQNV